MLSGESYLEEAVKIFVFTHWKKPEQTLRARGCRGAEGKGVPALTGPGAEQRAQHPEPAADDVAALGRQRTVRAPGPTARCVNTTSKTWLCWGRTAGKTRGRIRGVRNLFAGGAGAHGTGWPPRPSPSCASSCVRRVSWVLCQPCLSFPARTACPARPAPRHRLAQPPFCGRTASRRASPRRRFKGSSRSGTLGLGDGKRGNKK